MDIARGEKVEKELEQMIERRSRQKDPEEEHDLWKESERAYFARRDEERSLQLLAYHEGQAARLSNTLSALAAYHEEQANRYRR